jgi:hypothetical protein
VPAFVDELSVIEEHLVLDPSVLGVPKAGPMGEWVVVDDPDGCERHPDHEEHQQDGEQRPRPASPTYGRDRR